MALNKLVRDLLDAIPLGSTVKLPLCWTQYWNTKPVSKMTSTLKMPRALLVLHTWDLRSRIFWPAEDTETRIDLGCFPPEWQSEKERKVCERQKLSQVVEQISDLPPSTAMSSVRTLSSWACNSALSLIACISLWVFRMDFNTSFTTFLCCWTTRFNKHFWTTVIVN